MIIIDLAMSMAMIVPVLPHPALSKEKIVATFNDVIGFMTSGDPWWLTGELKALTIAFSIRLSARMNGFTSKLIE